MTMFLCIFFFFFFVGWRGLGAFSTFLTLNIINYICLQAIPLYCTVHDKII
jgi:hypothetical protein